jgi:hypothetical protein
MPEGEGFRPRPEHLPDLQRVVVAVDPATKSHENADMTAFAVAGRGYQVETMFGDDRPRGYLLHCEQDRHTPTQAMHRAVGLLLSRSGSCASRPRGAPVSTVVVERHADEDLGCRGPFLSVGTAGPRDQPITSRTRMAAE